MIIRVQKNNNNPYVMINKASIQDHRLSWKARGILSYFLSMPDSWEFYEEEIIRHSVDGRDSLRKGVRELEQYGYIQRKKNRTEKGKFKGYTYVIFENPSIDGNSVYGSNEDSKQLLPVAGKTVAGKSKDGKTVAGKSATSNNDLSNNDLSNKKTFVDNAEALRLVNLLKDLILNNNPAAKIPNDLTKWNIEIDRMIRKDKRNPQQIEEMILFSQNDNFWKCNVLSPDSLRKHFDRFLVMNQKNNGRKDVQTDEPKRKLVNDFKTL